jgi:hypothetical protein
MLEMPSKFSRPKVSQRVAMARALERRARSEARKRQRLGKRGPFSAGALDIVAAHVGWSRSTLAKALAVTKAAERDPRAFGGLVSSMDETGRVDRAYRDLQERRGMPVRRRRKQNYDDYPELTALSINKAETEIANCLLRIEILGGLIAAAVRCWSEPPRGRRFLNILPAGEVCRVITAVQNKQEVRKC